VTAGFAVRFTPPAEDDLDAIHDYISAHGSPQIADALLDKMMSRLARLEQFPDRGSPVPELAGLKHHFRQVSVSPYRCIYTVADANVIIVAVLDGRRNVRAVLEQRMLTGR
jgi:toxin ParE1/3/4